MDGNSSSPQWSNIYNLWERDFYYYNVSILIISPNHGTMLFGDISSPVVSTHGEMRKNIGRAYGGRACWISFRKELQLKLPVKSAMAAIPAFPSTPVQTHTHDQVYEDSEVYTSIIDPYFICFTWYVNSKHCHISLSQQAAQRSLYFSGGHVLSFPTKRVSASVSEIHVSKLIHYQNITWETPELKLTRWVYKRAECAFILFLCGFTWAQCTYINIDTRYDIQMINSFKNKWYIHMIYVHYWPFKWYK